MASTETRGAAATGSTEPRYLLLTQCLQNDLFLNRECRLFVGDLAARRLLLGWQAGERDGAAGPRLELSDAQVRSGPLGLFLEATIGGRLEGGGRGRLDVINIRDWHHADASYDQERKTYGAHCEQGTWGAAYVDGLARRLDPGGASRDEEARPYERGTVRIHHVHSDSLFDFRPRYGEQGSRVKFPPSLLERLLDELVGATDVDGDGCADSPLYVAVVGVYTDIKVKTLLTGLRGRYQLANLAVSDTLTASASLERHIGGLDYASRVLDVEVVHGLNNLIRFLGGAPSVEDEPELVGPDGYARYRSYFQDKQNVLAYQEEKLQDYLLLTERRALDTYRSIRLANRFLLAWGGAFLLATLALSIKGAVDPQPGDWKLPAITGGLSLLQVVSAFYSKPLRDLQRNLTNLAVFKMVLESHSLKTAFARFHLTTPQALRELQSDEEGAAAARQVQLLADQIEVIDRVDAVDFHALEQLGFGEAVAVAGANGAAPAAAPQASPS